MATPTFQESINGIAEMIEKARETFCVIEDTPALTKLESRMLWTWKQHINWLECVSVDLQQERFERDTI